uniref:Uncharacterized protein n=1 Tax=Esox lucius TaxID=8010 RepID=A0A3P8ZWN8_ESOLU
YFKNCVLFVHFQYNFLFAEIEAEEACDWWREAGFPQYVQLYKDFRFSINIDWVKSDHSLITRDSLCRGQHFNFYTERQKKRKQKVGTFQIS